MYNKRIWLNKEASSATGNMVAFDGEVYWKEERIRSTFLSISDCNNSIRLHPMDGDTIEDFVNKMKLLKNEIDAFINYLETKR
jgi:hypothetical protein